MTIAVHWTLAPAMPHARPRQPATAQQWARYWQQAAAALQDSVLRARERGQHLPWHEHEAAKAYMLARRWARRAATATSGPQ